MKRLAIVLLLAAAPLLAQRNNTFDVLSMPGTTVAQKTQAAQAKCDPSYPCVLIFDARLATYAEGTLPAKCATCSWFDYRTSGKVLVNGKDVGSTGGMRYVDQYSGASVGAKIDAACADLAGAQGLVVIPSTMGAGNSLVGLPDNCRVWDLRGIAGPDFLGQESQNWSKDLLFRGRWTSAPVGAQNLQTLHVHAEPVAGGSDNIAGKTNWAGISMTMPARTGGQHQGFSSWVYNFSVGDTIPFWGIAQGYGDALQGDEGIEGASFVAAQGGLGINGNGAVFEGEIASVTPCPGLCPYATVTYTNAVNEYTQGETRPLIKTTPGSVYSTGTIASIAGTPPVVTGVGTNWTSLGVLGLGEWWFSMDADTSSGLRLVVPISAVNSDTELVLDYNGLGVAAAWTGVTSGNYKIFQGTWVNSVEPLGTIRLANKNVFAVGDTFEQPVGPGYKMVGLNVTMWPALPAPSTTRPLGINLNNSGSQSVYAGLSVSGPFVRGIEFTNTWDKTSGMSDGVAPGIMFNHSPGRVIWNTDGAESTYLYVQDAAGGIGDTILSNPTDNTFRVGTTFAPDQFIFRLVDGQMQMGDLFLGQNWPAAGLNLYYDGGWRYKTSDSGSVVEQDYVNDGFNVQIAPVGVAGELSVSTSGLFIRNSDGYVGIGNITAPTSQLTVNGVIESKTGGIKFPDGTTQITAPVAAKTMLFFGSPTPLASNTINYSGPNTAPASNENASAEMMPLAGTAGNLRCYVQNTPAAGQTVTFTARAAASLAGMADSTITCTITGGSGTTCGDSLHTLAVPEADYFALKIVTSATTGNVVWHCSLQY